MGARDNVTRFNEMVAVELAAAARVLEAKRDHGRLKTATDANLKELWTAMHKAGLAYEEAWGEARRQVAEAEARILEAQFALDDARAASRRKFMEAMRLLHDLDE